MKLINVDIEEFRQLIYPEYLKLFPENLGKERAEKNCITTIKNYKGESDYENRNRYRWCNIRF